MTAADFPPGVRVEPGELGISPGSTESQRAEWLEWRRGGIGASDIAGLLLPGNWSSPWKVWAEKVGLLPPTESTARQRFGLRMERVLGEMTAEEIGLDVDYPQTQVTHPDHHWARATLDGIALDGETEVATVEYKTDGRFGWPDGPPPNYRAQCIWQMGVTGLRHAYLAVLFAGFRFEVFEIPWDDDAQADWELMFRTADRFWHKNVLNGDPPDVDGSEATTEALATVYPNHVEGVTADLSGMADLIVERDDLKESMKADKARLDAIDNELKARIGDAEVGVIDDVPVLTYRTQTRASYVAAESTFRVLRNAPQPKGKK